MKKQKSPSIKRKTEILKLIRLNNQLQSFKSEMKSKYGVTDSYINGVIKKPLIR